MQFKLLRCALDVVLLNRDRVDRCVIFV